MKTFKFSLVLRTRENTDVFISLDDNIYGIHSKRINILYIYHGYGQTPYCSRYCRSRGFRFEFQLGHITFRDSRVVEISNFITCPWTSKWSKSTCPTKIYLPKNWHFFLISRRKHMLWVLIRSASVRHF